MRFSIFQLPLLVALPVSALSLGNTAPGGQKALSDGPVIAANCYWDGTSPFCAGGCSAGYSDCGTNGCGDGACCVTGYKKYCCLGSCPSVYPANPGKLQPPTGNLHTAKGPNDDFCPPGKHILCPPKARNNEECECIDD